MEKMLLIIFVLAYLGIVLFLGWRGYRNTSSVTDYLLAGRRSHPWVMALSYGATFISTSAIVGFGGVAAVYGMGLMWLTFTNIAIGIFLAFILFGPPTRQLGLRLDAHTFPELLGRRYQSRIIQVSAAALIVLFMPLCASAVLMSAAKFFSEHIGLSYHEALVLFASIVALSVVIGGLKGVLYTDAFQAVVMTVGMVALLVLSYYRLGGLLPAYKKLAALRSEVPPALAVQGHQGWTAFPAFGSVLWWNLVGSLMMGVSIGVLAQPQLVVRFMTVRRETELYHAAPIGGLFIIFTVGVAYLLGPLTNVYFHETTGQLALRAAGNDVERIIPMYVTFALPRIFGILFLVTLLSAAMSTLSSQFHVIGTSFGRDWIEEGLGIPARFRGLHLTRLGMFAAILFALLLGLELERRLGKTGTEIVARSTAIFFGLCASIFLPIYGAALWSRSVTRAGALSAMLVGALANVLWMLFVQEKTETVFGLCHRWFGTRSLGLVGSASGATPLRTGPILWPYVDASLIALPLAVLTLAIVSALTPKLPASHLNRVFAEVPSDLLPDQTLPGS